MKLWLSEAEVQFANEDVPVALSWLEALAWIVRPPVKPNVSRPGWLPAAAKEPVWTSPEPVEEDVTGDAEDAHEERADEQRADALAAEIVRSFSVSDRGYNGVRGLCASETALGST